MPTVDVGGIKMVPVKAADSKLRIGQDAPAPQLVAAE
jgi:hypothetical protein